MRFKFLLLKIFFYIKYRPVSTKFDPHNPKHRHHQGTLRELHDITSKLSNGDCPPLNAISLPSGRRNLFIPPNFGSVASHEVAQSRIPSTYESTFDVADLRSHLEWSLIGSRGSVSPLHADSDGLGTIVVVLEGSKYWIVVTRFGEDEILSSIDSLGPKWNPYAINDDPNFADLRFEGVHLQKGDMMYVPF